MGVLLDPLRGAAQPRSRHVLAPSGRHSVHGGGRLLRRGWLRERCVRLLRWHVKNSFDTIRFIVTVGWSIYPLGYFFGYLMGQVNDDVLNLVYNLADFVNKIAFCLAIWQSAKNDTLERPGNALLA